MITFLKKYTNDSFEKLVNEIHWMDLPFRLKAIFSKLPSSGGDSRPYKVYTALLTQTGTDAPVATVLENTLGDIVWAYHAEGYYSATSVGLFTNNKTSIHHSLNRTTNSANFLAFFVADSDTIEMSSTDDLTVFKEAQMTTPSLIEIRVYN